MFRSRKYTIALILSLILVFSGMSNVFAEALKTAQENYNQAALLCTQGKYQESLPYLEECLKLDPKYTNAFALKGDVLLQLRKYTEAIAAYDKAIELGYSKSSLYSNKAVIFLNLNKLNEAIENADIAISMEPDNYYAHYNKGNALYFLKRYDEALIEADKSMTINPKFAPPYALKGDIYNSLKKYDDAIKSYDKYIEFDPKSSSAYRGKGVALIFSAKYNEGLTQLNKSIELAPTSAPSYYYRGIAYTALNKIPEAIESLKKAVEYNGLYKNNIANDKLFLKIKDFSEAEFNKLIAISVKVNNKLLEFDVPPTIIEGRTLVPLRVIFEALGAKLEWNGETKTVTGTKGDTVMVLKIDSTEATVNGKTVTLDVPATIIDGRTLVPARFIAESLGATVGWDDPTKTVVINGAK